jgi:dihydrofolate synthase/folylpolyglutamate synthase
LGDPHEGLLGALIGGTNGKGSTQAMLASVLRHGGYHVGQTPKPHLVSYRERIIVDGSRIPIDNFCDLVDEVLTHTRSVERRHGPPTEFEVLTAAAFTYFRRQKVDLAVVEVGLGGRLDATNVWSGGVSAITNVSLDHMEYLGTTVEQIAKEKAAIIKRGDYLAVTGASEPALGVVRRRAARMGVPLSVTSATDAAGYEIGLLGAHQRANAAIALRALDGLAQLGFAVAPETIRAGLASARWPGRLERIGARGVDVLLDGAHNPDGMRALGAALEELLPQPDAAPPILLVGILGNHWQDGMLEPLRQAVSGATLIATTVPDAPNAMEPVAIVRAWVSGALKAKAISESAVVPDVAMALDAAVTRASIEGRTVVVCGSLYLVGHVRAQLVGD